MFQHNEAHLRVRGSLKLFDAAITRAEDLYWQA